jgi:hypothetical protein
MRKKVERLCGRVRFRTLLLVSGAVATVAAALTLGEAGSPESVGRHESSPRAMESLRDVFSPALPQRKPSVSAAAATPASPTFPHVKTGERDDGRGGARHVKAVRHPAHIDGPHGRLEVARSRPLADPAAERRTPPPGPRAKHAPGGPWSISPDPSRRDGKPSLIGMKCDELFPPHKREFRLRNIACHRVLG